MLLVNKFVFNKMPKTWVKVFLVKVYGELQSRHKMMIQLVLLSLKQT